MKIGVLLYTFNRTDDARINEEIIRNVWPQSDLLKQVTIVHAFDGEKEWWPEKYLEDELLELPNTGHFAGAELLLNEGIRCFAENYPDITYVIVLAADTWCVYPPYLEKIIRALDDKEGYLAACAWGTQKANDPWKVGMSLDFMVVNRPWATEFGLFPIHFSEFAKKYSDLFAYRGELVYLERVFVARFKEAVLRSVSLPSDNLLKKAANAHFFQMKEREPVHDAERNLLGLTKKGRKMYWPRLGLITHHEPEPKRKILRKWNLPLGESGRRFLAAADLSYYNRGLGKNVYAKGDKKPISYGD